MSSKKSIRERTLPNRLTKRDYLNILKTLCREEASGISYRVKSFLESLGITTTKLGRGRVRATSVKDVHSLRHTFAYLAGCYQIPLPVVQSILGHMSPEMTKHYQAHADREAKEKYLAKLPNFIGKSEVRAIGRQTTDLRRQIEQRISSLSEQQLEKVQAFLEKL